MMAETYKGRKLKVHARRGRRLGTMDAHVNGMAVHAVEEFNEATALAELRLFIDAIDEDGVNGDRWAAHWYAPGTYSLCEWGHPVAKGEDCRHSWCRKNDAAPNE